MLPLLEKGHQENASGKDYDKPLSYLLKECSQVVTVQIQENILIFYCMGTADNQLQGDLVENWENSVSQ